VNEEKQRKWDDRFLAMALLVSLNSKDPSTKVGAVIVDEKYRLVGSGFNGFPRGVDDHETRYLDKELKHEIVIHAEVNAILFSNKPVEGCTLYSTFFPCPRCAGVIINAGIRRVVAPTHLRDKDYTARQEVSRTMFNEAGVSYKVMHNDMT